MMPTVVHRYSITTAEVARALLDVGDCEKIDVFIVGENLVFDVIGPAGEQPAEHTVQEVEMEEPPPAPETPPQQPERKGGDLARRAGILCNEGAFRLWAEVATVEAAKQFMYRRCGIESRVDLDHEPEAAAKFRDMIAEYDAWLSAPE
jgi:hypothetical protein